MIAIIKSPRRDLGLEMSFCYQRPQNQGVFLHNQICLPVKEKSNLECKKKLESFRESETVLTRDF